MTTEQYPSRLLERAVSEFAKLPGIGRKTALRFALHTLSRDENSVAAMAESILRLRREVKYCRVCHNISDTDVCEICANPRRDASTICVVENVRSVMSFESTGLYHGLYHVLGGVISPMDGIGPADLRLDSLFERVAQGGIKEVILALNPTMEGDTTDVYIFRRLAPYPEVKVTMLARGVSVGNEIEYTDELTLGRSIMNRTLFSDSFAKQ